ncbi:MAG: hypothetical protein QOH57_1326 [Mycobacterium sp.]|nr:hypothetical protein [Mycobacterium sp.]
MVDVSGLEVVISVVTVVVDGESDEVVVLREDDVFGVIGPLELGLDPPKIKKITVANRKPPIAPYMTIAHGIAYHGVAGPGGPGGTPVVSMNSVGCSALSPGSVGP